LRYLLDTNTVSAIGKRAPGYDLIAQRWSEALRAREVVGLSIVTVYEVRRGIIAGEGRMRVQTRAQMGLALAQFQWFDLDGNAAEAAAQIGAELSRKGKPIGPLDTLIAGHAMPLNAVVVTNNVKEFARVPGLKVEDWAE
jgi:tRNA(fMet)-specific endonuclease VapC